MSHTMGTSIGGQPQVPGTPSSIPAAATNSLYDQFQRQGIDPDDIQFTASTDNPNIVHAHIIVRGKDTDGVEKQTTIILQIPLQLEGAGKSDRIAAFKRAGMLALTTHQTALAILRGDAGHKFVGIAKGHAAVSAFFAKGTHLDLDISGSGDVRLQAGRYDAIGKGEYTSVSGKDAIVVTGAKTAHVARYALELTRALHDPENITGDTNLENEIDETLKDFDTPLAAEAKAAARAVSRRCGEIIEANNEKIKELKDALAALPPGSLTANTQRILEAIAEARDKNQFLHDIMLDVQDHAYRLVEAERDLNVVQHLPQSGASVTTAQSNLQAATRNYYKALARYEQMATGHGEARFQSESGVSGVREFFTYLKGAIQHRSREGGREAVIRSRAEREPEGSPQMHLQDATLSGIRDEQSTSILRNLESAEHPTDQLDACLALVGRQRAFADKLEATAKFINTNLVSQAQALTHAADLLNQFNKGDPLPKVGSALATTSTSEVLDASQEQCQAMLQFVRQMVPGSLNDKPPVLTAPALSQAFKQLLTLANQLRINSETEPSCQAFLTLANTLATANNSQAMNQALDDLFSDENLDAFNEFVEICHNRETCLAELRVQLNTLQVNLADDPEGSIETACTELGIGTDPLTNPGTSDPTDHQAYGMQVLARSLLDSTLGSANRILRGQVSLGGGVGLDIRPMPAMENARRNFFGSLGLRHDASLADISRTLTPLLMGLRDNENRSWGYDSAQKICQDIYKGDPHTMKLLSESRIITQLKRDLSTIQNNPPAFQTQTLTHLQSALQREQAEETRLNSLLNPGSPIDTPISTEDQTALTNVQANIAALKQQISDFSAADPAAIARQLTRFVDLLHAADQQVVAERIGLASVSQALYHPQCNPTSDVTTTEEPEAVLRNNLISILGEGYTSGPQIERGIVNGNPRDILSMNAPGDRVTNYQNFKALLEGKIAQLSQLQTDSDSAKSTFAAIDLQEVQALLAVVNKANEILEKEERELAEGTQPIAIPTPPPRQRALRTSPAGAATRGAPAATGPMWQGPQLMTSPASSHVPNIALNSARSLPVLNSASPEGFTNWTDYFQKQGLPHFKVSGRGPGKEQGYDTSIAQRQDTRLDGGTGTLMFYRDHETPHSSLFGNFEECPNGVTVDLGPPFGQRIFKNAECAFQAAKIPLLPLDATAADTLMRKLQGFKTGDDAWSTIRDEINQPFQAVQGNWQTIKDKVMLAVVTAKFSQNPKFAAALLSQEGKTLIENSGDVPGDWSIHSTKTGLGGKNLLGCALMQAMQNPSVIAAAAQSPVHPQRFNPHYTGTGTAGQKLAAMPKPTATAAATAAATARAAGVPSYRHSTINHPRS